jgi:hypothetical protein
MKYILILICLARIPDRLRRVGCSCVLQYIYTLLIERSIICDNMRNLPLRHLLKMHV